MERSPAPGGDQRLRQLRTLLGTSEMARRIIERNWAPTPLGPIVEWPETLTRMLATILRSSFQLAIYWGPELILLYNDAESKPLGNLHPHALGQPARIVLNDMWHDVGPMLSDVLVTGRPTWSEDAPLVLRRRRSLEEAYFTWSYSPIIGDDGMPEGVLLVSTETTRHVLGERRLRTLERITEHAGHARSTDEVWQRSVEALVEDPDILSAEIQVLEGDTPVRRAAAGGATGGRRARRDDGDLEGGPGTIVRLPIRAGAPVAAAPVLVLGISPLRPLEQGQREYMQLM
jgi:hypothetical protein